MPEGAPPPREDSGPHAIFDGEVDMMVTNISSGRLLMKSTFAGGSCGSGSTRPRFLAGSSSISQQVGILGGGACS